MGKKNKKKKIFYNSKFIEHFLILVSAITGFSISSFASLIYFFLHNLKKTTKKRLLEGDKFMVLVEHSLKTKNTKI